MMATTLTINNWLQEAIERACEDRIKAFYKQQALDDGDDYIYATVTASSYGVTVNVSWTNHSTEFVEKSEWFSPQEAMKVFLGQDLKDAK